MKHYISTTNYQGEPDRPYLMSQREEPTRYKKEYKFEVESVGKTDSSKYYATITCKDVNLRKTIEISKNQYHEFLSEI